MNPKNGLSRRRSSLITAHLLPRKADGEPAVSSSGDFNGKVVIVTGGAGGIGSAISSKFAASGATVVLSSRKVANLERTVADIVAAGGNAVSIAADVTIPEQVQRLVDETVARFGAIDVMINNAGSALHIGKPEKQTFEQWSAIIALNLHSVFLGCTAAANQMIKQGYGGRIINISSKAGSHGHESMVGYGAAKAGVNNLTESLANAWACHGIAVNSVAPGLTSTPRVMKAGWIPTPVDKDGNCVGKLQTAPSPEDVANLVLFLASSAADAITGQVMPIEADSRMGSK